MGVLDVAMQIIFCLLVAAILGWIIGFLLGRIFGSANATELLKENESKVRVREQELSAARNELTTANSRITVLQTEIAALAATVKTRDQWLSEMETKQQELQQDLDARISELDELKTETDQEKSALKTQLETAQAQRAAFEEERDREITRLKVRITELEMMARAIKEPVGKSPTTAPISPSPRERDNLQQIVGIGPKIERLLNEHGVYCFRQIAEWSSEDISHYNELLPQFQGRIERDDWIASAKAEHQKKYGELL